MKNLKPFLLLFGLRCLSNPVVAVIKKLLFQRKEIMKIILIGISFLLWGGFTVADENSSEPLNNRYIVVLKQAQPQEESESYQKASAAFKKSNGNSYTNIRATAERLIREADQNQALVENRRGVSAKMSKKTESNKLEHVYQHAIQGFSATLTPEGLEYIKSNPAVDYVEMDHPVSINTLQTPATWGLDRIDQRHLPLNEVYEYQRDGAGVHAYVIDTGIRATHNQFGGRVGNGVDIVDNDNDANDCHGHGTHVAGTIGGHDFGVAKNITLHGVRVLNCRGSGWTTDVIAGIDWVADRENTQFPAVINMSLGGGANRVEDTAIDNAVAAGITVVVAAGNNGGDACLRSPARAERAITVAASNDHDQRPYFSNIGRCVDLFAPGQDIMSASNKGDDEIEEMSGTSMAAPHVAGVAALYLQGHPNASPEQVADVITASATRGAIGGDIGEESPNLLLSAYGVGARIDKNAYSVMSGETVTITANNSFSLQNSLIYSWNFGDGSAIQDTTEPSVSHKYSGAGTYKVRLTVSDGDQETSTTTASVTAYNPVVIVTTVIIPMLLG